MQIRTLVAAGAAIGAAALSLGLAVPANAAPAVPKASVAPNPFKAGQKVAVTATGCKDTPVTKSNQIFSEAPAFPDAPAGGKFVGETNAKTTLKAGQKYTTLFECTPEGSTGTEKTEFGLTTQLPKEEEPKFKFGRDDIDFSTTEVKPGGSVTIRVTCPSTVSSTSDSFAVAPDWKKINAAKNLWEGKGVYKQNLPKVSHLTITCKGFGSVPFTTQADGKNMGGSNGTIPSGDGPATGDGSLSTVSLIGSDDSGSALPLIAGGSAAALAVAGLGVVLVRRRHGVQE